MAKEKSRATARADAASRQSAIDKRHRVSKKVSKQGHHNRPFIPHGPRVDLPARLPVAKSAFKSYFEFQENTDKKDKKLETSVTKDKNPPPGFSFVPVGNPELTKTCKELSREKGYMIMIVSDTKEENKSLSDHVQRVGYHFRSTVVEEACNELGGLDSALGGQSFTLTENDKIPETQAEINKQADAALRDLFPRIPNIDREQIIAQSFQKGAIGNSRKGEPVVGLAPGVPLARRVQLAANAHIRHVHTRYDKLLRQTDWYNARKLVEPVCLEVIMKWRGDEETGRDQLDEILREVVLIPDSDDEEDGKDTAESASEDEVQFLREVTRAPSRLHSPPHTRTQQDNMPHAHPAASSKLHIDDPGYEDQQQKLNKGRKRLAKQQKNQARRKQKQQRPDKQERRGFERYQRYAEAKKRTENGNAASAGLDYGDDNGRQDSVPQPRYPLRSMEGHRVLGGPSGEQMNDSRGYPRHIEYQKVGTSNAHPLDGLPDQNRLPDTPQDMFAAQPLRRQFIHHDMPEEESVPSINRAQQQGTVSALHGLPVLTEAEHQQRQQLHQHNQHHKQRPRSPEDPVLESIENMDISNSPVPVRRSHQHQQLENAAPRRVQTAQQPFFGMKHDHIDLEPTYRPVPGASDIIYVHDQNGKRRRVLEEPNQQYAQPTHFEYVAAPRPRQDAYTIPVPRAHVPVSQPDIRWIDEATDAREPILISSSPYMANVPAMAPQSRPILRGGQPHSRQASDNFEGSFHDARETVGPRRGELERPKPTSGVVQGQFADEPAMRRVEPRQPVFVAPSVLQRASTAQHASQEKRRPEPKPSGNGHPPEQPPMERLPVYNEYGQRIEVGEAELQHIVQLADSRPPVYVRGSTRDPRQLREQFERFESESPPRQQYVSQAGPRYEFLPQRPGVAVRTQSDMNGQQPRYRERTIYVGEYSAPPPRQVQPIRRSPVEHIGANGQRYVTIPGVNGQPDEVLPVRSGPMPTSRPQSRMYREGTRGPERGPERVQSRQGGFQAYDGYDGGYGQQQQQQQQQQQHQQRRYERSEVVVLDD